MPQNVRNFWVEVSIDGQKTKMKGGPRSKSGGLSCVVYQRNKGLVEEVCRVECTALEKKLHLQFRSHGKVVFQKNTER